MAAVGVGVSTHAAATRGRGRRGEGARTRCTCGARGASFRTRALPRPRDGRLFIEDQDVAASVSTQNQLRKRRWINWSLFTTVSSLGMTFRRDEGCLEALADEADNNGYLPNKGRESELENSMEALKGRGYGKTKMRYSDYTLTESGLQYKVKLSLSLSLSLRNDGSSVDSNIAFFFFLPSFSPPPKKKNKKYRISKRVRDQVQSLENKLWSTGTDIPLGTTAESSKLETNQKEARLKETKRSTSGSEWDKTRCV